MQSRKDKFYIAETCSIQEGIDKIKSRIPEYEGVIISDVHSNERNQILKLCYDLSIRVYLTPKKFRIFLFVAQRCLYLIRHCYYQEIMA